MTLLMLLQWLLFVCVEMFRAAAPERPRRRAGDPSGVSGEAPLQARELASAQDHEVSTHTCIDTCVRQKASVRTTDVSVSQNRGASVIWQIPAVRKRRNLRATESLTQLWTHVIEISHGNAFERWMRQPEMCTRFLNKWKLCDWKEII